MKCHALLSVKYYFLFKFCMQNVKKEVKCCKSLCVFKFMKICPPEATVSERCSPVKRVGRKVAPRLCEQRKGGGFGVYPPRKFGKPEHLRNDSPVHRSLYTVSEVFPPRNILRVYIAATAFCLTHFKARHKDHIFTVVNIFFCQR